MIYDYIAKKSKTLIKKCKSRDPFEIADALGITVLFRNDFTTLKGMYRVIKRNRFIFINANLDENMQKIVCMHELGHDQLHRELAVSNSLKEFVLYKMDTRPEYEANLFAAEILLPDDDVLNLVREGKDIEEISRILYSDINLVSMKVAILANKGYPLRKIDSKADFLK